jgi:hypothetical protein
MSMATGTNVETSLKNSILKKLRSKQENKTCFDCPARYFVVRLCSRLTVWAYEHPNFFNWGSLGACGVICL